MHTTFGRGPECLITSAANQVVDSLAISNTTPIVMYLPALDCIGLGIVYATTGTLAGSFKFEISNDYQPDVGFGTPARAGTWVDATSFFAPSLTAISSPTTDFLQISQFWFAYARLTFTPTSGSGNLSVYRVTKASN